MLSSERKIIFRLEKSFRTFKSDFEKASQQMCTILSAALSNLCILVEEHKLTASKAKTIEKQCRRGQAIQKKLAFREIKFQQEFQAAAQALTGNFSRRSPFHINDVMNELQRISFAHYCLVDSKTKGVAELQKTFNDFRGAHISYIIDIYAILKFYNSFQQICHVLSKYTNNKKHLTEPLFWFAKSAREKIAL